MQNDPTIPMVPCFSVHGLEPPKNHVWLYDVTISHHVVERDLAFGVKNRGIDLKILSCGGRWLDV